MPGVKAIGIGRRQLDLVDIPEGGRVPFRDRLASFAHFETARQLMNTDCRGNVSKVVFESGGGDTVIPTS